MPFQDLASDEIQIDLGLPTSGGLDHSVIVLGGGVGAICVLELENYLLRSLRSADGGQSFDGELDVTGGPGAGAVLAYAADLAVDDAVHVALVVADPSGDRGLRFVRSPDRCQSWDAPVDLIMSADPAHGVTAVAVGSGGAGFASVAFIGRDGLAPYAITTANGGSTWTAPVRLDPGNGGTFATTPSISLDVDAAGNTVYAAWDQDRGSGSQIWTTRSTDGGATFVVEQNLDPVTPFRGESSRPSVQVVEGGELLIAYWDISSGNRMFVAQSKNQGTTFSSTYEENVGGGDALGVPTFCYVTGDTTLHLFWTISDSLWHSRSANNGDSFDDGSTLSTTADADPDNWRPATRVQCAKIGNRAWVVGSSDYRNDTYAGTRTDVYVHRSTDDGVTWLPAERADTDGAGGAESSFGGLVATTGGDFFTAWSDRRDDAGRGENLYGIVYSDGVGFALSDARIDSDAGVASAATLQEPVVASDGATGVYVAFSGRGHGHEHDIWVTRSADGGYTFDSAVRASTTPAGDRVQFVPYLAATPDGNVYLAWLADDPISGQRQLRFNRSSDFGATWQPVDQVLDAISHPVGYFLESFDFPNIQLRAVDGGLVYVAWSDLATVFLARSENGGASFTIEDVDQDSRNFNRYPALCAQGDQVVLAIMSPDTAFIDFSVWGTVSADRGATWTTMEQLRSESTPERGIFPVLSCDGGSGALVVWGDLRNNSTWQLFSNRWDGAWQGDVVVNGPAALDHFWPTVARAGTSDVVVSYQDFDGAVYAARSQDGGATFPAHVRLDNAAPEPAAVSESPRITGDGDDLWVFWMDDSSGDRSIAVRWSRDGGGAWSPARRVNRETPDGALPNGYYPINATAAALPDAGFLAWGGDRNDPGGDVLTNAADLTDGDRDTVDAGADCDDTDPTAWAIPTPVANISVVLVSNDVHLDWESQTGSTGPGTIYDVATGLLSDLLAGGTYVASSCLAADLPQPGYDDTRGNPATGDADYYLIRSRNGCGAGGYGDSGLSPDPRDGLDAASPCP
ncbi:MAG: exo-alpha-sialidase [Acidobacteria bacterium]|uniref:Exo-alpha-sialidase n=1 Tax=Candidatus Polarisedimenticola svalbardensis TaxID=2886004 RepID=A0A8J7C1I4_9BACT|nr:exo-alpha-sialidase [Candidatus Polarisedimenticola svalbardensis]